jgi:hypothetical protein
MEPLIRDMGLGILIGKKLGDKIKDGPDIVFTAPKVCVLVDRQLQVLDLLPHLADLLANLVDLGLVVKHKPVKVNLLIDVDPMLVLYWLLVGEV